MLLERDVSEKWKNCMEIMFFPSSGLREEICWGYTRQMFMITYGERSYQEVIL